MVGGTGGTVQLRQGDQTMMLPQTIQISTPNGQTQIIPISSLIGGGQQFVIQQPQPPQFFQASNGQIYLYQPGQLSNQVAQSQPTVININGNLVQITGTSQSTTAVSTTPVQTITSPTTTARATQAEHIVMMMPESSDQVQFQRGALPNSDFLKKDPLYVNAKQYKRILKRREARAKLEAEGKIPKERSKYLHEARHRVAMNRIRDESGRFHPSGQVEKQKRTNTNDITENITTLTSTNTIRIISLTKTNLNVQHQDTDNMTPTIKIEGTEVSLSDMIADSVYDE